MADVFNILEVDSYVRTLLQQGQVDAYYDITTLQNIDFGKDWDYSLPTISPQPSYSNSDRIRDMNLFKERWDDMYRDYFSHVDFNNLLIAGGSVMGTLLQKNWNNDVDIFIYGLSEEQAIKKLRTIIAQMYESYRESKHVDEKIESKTNIGSDAISRNTNHSVKKKKKSMIKVITLRNRNAITLKFDSGQVIQIILRLYKSVSEILHGFDLGSCAVGYDSNNVYFTSLGKYSYENFVNIIDPSRRSTTYEDRLRKYLYRGFRIILPYLDINKLKVNNLKYNILEVAALPYFPFSYNSVKGNVIQVARVLSFGNKKNEQTCDYGDFDMLEYSAFYLNLRVLVKQGEPITTPNSQEQRNGYYHYNTQMDDNILTSAPYISASKIIDYYDSLEKRIYDGDIFNANIFRSYFSVEVLPLILTDLFLNKGGPSKLSELIETQKQEVLYKLLSLKPEDYKLRFLTKNPGTQLSGSFNPIMSDYRDWYGDYLKV